MNIPQPCHELLQETPKTCFCINKSFSAAFGEWRISEEVVNENNNSEHKPPCLCACGDRATAINEDGKNTKMTKKYGVVNQRRKISEGQDEANVFCHLEDSKEHIQLYRKRKKIDDKTSGTESTTDNQSIPATAIEPPVTATNAAVVVYKDPSGVCYMEPSYPPLYGTTFEVLYDPILANDERGNDWVPRNAVFQSKSNYGHLYHSVGYLNHLQSRRPPSLVRRTKQAKRKSIASSLSSSSSVKNDQEIIAVKNNKNKEGKLCTTVEFESPQNKKEDLQSVITSNVFKETSPQVRVSTELKQSEHQGGQRVYSGQLRRGRIKSSSMDVLQENMCGLFIDQTLSSDMCEDLVSKFDTISKRREQRLSQRSRQSLHSIERRDTVISIPSKSSSSSNLPNLQINTCSSSLGLQKEDRRVKMSRRSDKPRNKDTANPNTPTVVNSVLLSAPKHSQLLNTLMPLKQAASKVLIEQSHRLPRPFKTASKLTNKSSPLISSASSKRHTTRAHHKGTPMVYKSLPRDSHSVDNTRCILRSQERRKVRLHRRDHRSTTKNYSQRAVVQRPHRVKVCLRGNKVQLVDPLMMLTQISCGENNSSLSGLYEE